MYEYLLFWLQIYNKIMKRANKLSFLPLLHGIFVLARLSSLWQAQLHGHRQVEMQEVTFCLLMDDLLRGVR